MSEIERLIRELQKALDVGDFLEAGKSSAAVGQIILERNLYREAAQYFQEASGYFESAGEMLLSARSLNHLGICLVMQKESLLALDKLNKALELIDISIDPGLEAAIHGNIGLAHSSRRDHKNAIKAHKLVLDVAETESDDNLRLKALINLADSNLQDNNYSSAQGYALVALDVAKEIRSTSGSILILDLLGMISARQGNLKDAVDYHQQSYLAAREHGDLFRQGIALANTGLALEGLTDMEGALEAIVLAEEIFLLLNSDYVEKTREDLKRVRTALP